MKINNIIEKVIGYILLSPAIYSVWVFFYWHWGYRIFGDSERFQSWYTIWFGTATISDHISTDVIYFSIMAIAGAYLIKDNKK